MVQTIERCDRILRIAAHSPGGVKLNDIYCVRNGLRRKGKTVCSQATVFAQTSCFNLIKTLYAFI